MGATLLSLPILAAASIVWVTPLPRVDYWFFFGVLGSAILTIFAQLTSTHALKISDASFVTPLLTFNPVFTLMISAMTLTEIPATTDVIGVAFIMLGTYLLNLENNLNWLAPFRAITRNRAFLLALLAAFLWGITPILEKIAIEHTTSQNPPLIALGTTVPIAFFLAPQIVRHVDHMSVLIVRQFRGFIIAGIISGVAPILGFTSITLGFVGYVTAIFKLSAVFTVLWGALILHEGNFKQRLPASLLMALGALVITL